MGISRLKQDSVATQSQTVILTAAPSFSQVFDLGQIRSVYASMTLLSQNNDTVPLGISNPGEYAWQTITPLATQTPQQSRDGVTYTPLGPAPTGPQFWDAGALPLLLEEAYGLTTRYVKFEAVFYSTIDGLVYAGAQHPTSSWQVYVEYI